MKISTILDHIDSGHMALPEFQRGYVWSREQVRGLFGSLYRRHPVGGLLVWVTDSSSANYRGDGGVAPGVVKLLLDGQQRMTSLYGVARGKPPAFFDGNAQAFTGLRFHLENEVFEFFQPVTMKDDPLWVDVSEIMKAGQKGHEDFIEKLAENPAIGVKAVKYSARISRLLSILDIDLHIEEVTGADKTLDIVVDIFNRVNSGGTKLSKGDLALAKICADWPEARGHMKSSIQAWNKAGYEFNLDWLLRSVNTVLTGEAKFAFLHDQTSDQIKEGLKRAGKQIDSCLNMIAGRLGLDHARVLFGRFAIPVMVRYLDQKGSKMSAVERDKLLFWFVSAGMWGRYSGSTESYLDRDLEMLEGADGGLEKLMRELRVWHGDLAVQPEHFDGWSMGSRFYPVLYMMTRMGEASDLGSGLPLKANMLGKMSQLEVHHIFPKAQLYKHGYERREVNALGNFCFLTKDTNLGISDERPEVYFPEIEARHPGALASQWIPMDPKLWTMDAYPAFLAARRKLLADQANKCLTDLLHGDTTYLPLASSAASSKQVAAARPVIGGVVTEEEEAELLKVNAWVVERGLSAGQIAYDYADPESGEQKAIFDLVWMDGLQAGLSAPVALLLDERDDVLELANKAGLRCFRSIKAFEDYVNAEVLASA